MVADPEPAQAWWPTEARKLFPEPHAGDDEVLVLTDPAAVGQPQQLVLVEVAASAKSTSSMAA